VSIFGSKELIPNLAFEPKKKKKNKKKRRKREINSQPCELGKFVD
jgi:hypothetical protein